MALSMMIAGPSGLARRLQMERPSSPGSMTSSTTRSGRAASESTFDALSVGRGLHGIAVPTKKLGHDITDPRVVVDDEDGFLSRFVGFGHQYIRHEAIRCARAFARQCRGCNNTVTRRRRS